MLLIAPQIAPSSHGREPNIYRGFPLPHEFLGSISTYTGALWISHGTEDDVVPQEHSLDLYRAASTKDKTFHPIPGDHSFSSPEARQGYVQEHILAFSD